MLQGVGVPLCRHGAPSQVDLLADGPLVSAGRTPGIRGERQSDCHKWPFCFWEDGGRIRAAS